jgi:catechol 2,3-dioxygenase-like lactoylglutathione lyase family enzyme
LTRVIKEQVLRVSDLQKAVAFYTDLLGTNPVESTEWSADFLAEGFKVHLHRKDAPGADERFNKDHAVLFVDDLEATHRELSGKGIIFAVGPTTFPWGRSAYLFDGDGRLVEVKDLKTEDLLQF